MTVLWRDLKSELVDRLGIGMEALWSLVRTAQSGVLALSLIEPLDEDMRLSDAAMDLTLALDEMEEVSPALAAGGISVDLGPVRLDDLGDYRASILGLLGAAIDVVAHMLREQVEELDTPELMSLATVASSINSARQLLLVPAT